MYQSVEGYIILYSLKHSKVFFCVEKKRITVNHKKVKKEEKYFIFQRCHSNWIKRTVGRFMFLIYIKKNFSQLCCSECSVLCYLSVFNTVIQPNTGHKVSRMTQISNDETAGLCNTLHYRSIRCYLLSQDSEESFLTSVRRLVSKASHKKVSLMEFIHSTTMPPDLSFSFTSPS